MSRYRVSMDIGGTFTDVVAYDEGPGTYAAGKASTTPHDLTEGVLAGLRAGRRLAAATSPSPSTARPRASTPSCSAAASASSCWPRAAPATSTTLPAATGHVSTTSTSASPSRCVPRADIVEIGGRLDYAGEELEPLDEDAVRAAARRAREEGFGAIAVAFLFSYVNPAHELRAEEILREELDGVTVSLSHRVAREWREYERTSLHGHRRLHGADRAPLPRAAGVRAARRAGWRCRCTSCSRAAAS